MVRMGGQWYKLLKEVIESSSLEVFKKMLDGHAPGIREEEQILRLGGDGLDYLCGPFQPCDSLNNNA